MEQEIQYDKDFKEGHASPCIPLLPDSKNARIYPIIYKDYLFKVEGESDYFLLPLHFLDSVQQLATCPF